MTLFHILYFFGLPFAFLLTIEVFRIHIKNKNFKYESEDLFLLIFLIILFTCWSWFSVIIESFYLYIYKNSDKLLEILNSEKSIFEILKNKK